MEISIREAGTYYAYIMIEEGQTKIDLGLCDRRELYDYRDCFYNALEELDETIDRIAEREKTHKRLEEQRWIT